METVTDFIFSGCKITADGDCSHEIKRCLLLGRKAMRNLNSILKNREITLPIKVYLVKTMVFPVVMYGCELDHKEGWASKNWCFRTVVLEKTLESPLDSQKIKPVNLKGNQSWIFIGRTDAEAPIHWLPDVKSWHIGKDPDAGKIEGRRRSRMRGWETQWTWVWASSVPEGQGNLVCCNPGVTESQPWLSDWTTKHASKQEYRILLR